MRGHGWVTGGYAQDGSTKTQREQTQMTDTVMDGQSQVDERGCAHGEERGWAAVESAVELGGRWAGRQASEVAGVPTYGLPCAGVVVALAAAALKLHLQPGQSLQLPLDGVSS